MTTTLWISVNLALGVAYYLAPLQLVWMYRSATRDIREHLGEQALAFTKDERDALLSYGLFLASCATHHARDAFREPHFDWFLLVLLVEAFAVYRAIAIVYRTRKSMIERIRQSARGIIGPVEVARLTRLVNKLKDAADAS